MKTGLIDREKLLDVYITRLVDDMKIHELVTIAELALSEEYQYATLNEIVNEVNAVYPDLLED